MQVRKISAEEAFKRFAFGKMSPQFSCAIDVRSSIEFNKGHLPNSECLPILSDEHRHQVGSTYKQFGSDQAFAVAEELVSPIRKNLIKKWSERLSECDSHRPGLLLCWRGGSRSRFAAHWLQSEGYEVLQVDKGFKELRRLSLKQFETYPKMLVIGGMTGSGKSHLLKSFKNKFLDLESAANHRGSAFGSYINQAQPQQVTFEFRLAFEFYKKSHEIFLEDESQNIGRVRMPKSLYVKMAQSPSILIVSSPQERAQNIYNEYIVDCLKSGICLESIKKSALQSVNRIKVKLGGKEYTDLCRAIEIAFSHKEQDPDVHKKWIIHLLKIYYDPLYKYSLSKKNRATLFQGNVEDCRCWLEDREEKEILEQ